MPERLTAASEAFRFTSEPGHRAGLISFPKKHHDRSAINLNARLGCGMCIPGHISANFRTLLRAAADGNYRADRMYRCDIR